MHSTVNAGRMATNETKGLKYIETSAKKVKKPAYSILESKNKKFGEFDGNKGKNIGIEYQ